mmetsp:Transcript_31793/g.73040  ORF Transcript_31793/g.73040 Transcript_31793/m.73040 type:complete len:400 (-) Transcript_31793:14-1213(-)
MLVAHDLHLKMARVLTELHEKDRRADDFVSDLDVGFAKVIFVVYKANTLAAATLGGLDHDTVVVADTFGGLHSFLDVAAGGLFEGVVRNGSFLSQFGLERTITGSTPGSGPGNAGNLCGLRKNVRGNLVSQHAHDRTGGPDELDAHLLQRVGQIGILGRVPPPGPHGVHSVLHCDLHDHVHVRVVVQILSRRHLHERVGQTDKLRVRLDVLGRGHGDELQALLVTQLHKGPLSHGEDGFGGGHAVVGDQDLADGTAAAAGFDVVVQELVAGILLGVHGQVGRGDHGQASGVVQGGVLYGHASESSIAQAGGDERSTCCEGVRVRDEEAEGRRRKRQSTAHHVEKIKGSWVRSRCSSPRSSSPSLWWYQCSEVAASVGCVCVRWRRRGAIYDLYPSRYGA